MFERFEEALPFIPDSDIRNWVGPFQEKSFYHELGLTQARKVKAWLQISPSSSVLDLGCGCGRLALHFLNEIDATGRYCGLDCSPDLVEFGRHSLSTANPAFSFSILDTQNGAYNPDGRLDAKSVRFPFEDQHFNSAFAWSVFTHMDFDSVRNYLGETARLLSAGGLLCLTMNLHGSDTLERMAAGQSTVNLVEGVGPHSLTINLEKPEECFSHSREALESVLEHCGFEVLESLEGWWSFGRPQGEYHDCLICRKKAIS